MKRAVVGSIAALMMGVGGVLGQAPAPPAAVEVLPKPNPVTPNGAPAPMPAKSPLDTTALPMHAPLGQNEIIPVSDNVYSPYLAENFNKGRALKNCDTVYVDTPYFWFHANLLFGFIKNDGTNGPLVTSGSTLDPAPGALGQPGTAVLYDGSSIVDNPLMGGRFTGGLWLQECQTLGVEFDYMFLGAGSKKFLAGTTSDSPVLGRPFFNVDTGLEDIFYTGNGGTTGGRVLVNSSSRVQSAQGHFLKSLSRGWTWRLDGICGVRWIGFDEDLDFFDGIRFTAPDGAIVDFGVTDQFGTRNDFVGGNFGARFAWKGERWTFDSTGQIAFGGVNETIRIQGYNSVGINGTEFTTGGGRMAVASNSGNFNRTHFAVAPEIGFNFGYQCCDWLKFTMGYNYIYLSNLVRPADQFDRNVNPVQSALGPGGAAQAAIPGQPGVPFKQTDLWIQTLSLGMVLTY